MLALLDRLHVLGFATGSRRARGQLIRNVALMGTRAGDNLEAFIADMQRLPLGMGGHRVFSAHQMSSCRKGSDPATSVANPCGELHDTPGAWVGDASALPTATGVNPLISTMAIAHRTAEAITKTATAALAAVHG
jgi:choline dehydrogenase-like flavoprotein